MTNNCENTASAATSAARIFDIAHGSFVDGPGIRTTVFFKGCNLNCRWCHNPESRSGGVERLFYAEKCRHCGVCAETCRHKEGCILCGECAKVCPSGAISLCGRDMDISSLMSEIRSDIPFYRGEGGVTFSGGECMLQIEPLEELLRECRRLSVNTAVDTAGNVGFGRFERILPFTDVFLYDLKCTDEKKHLEYIGASNARILENLAYLLDFGANVIIRMPLVSGINDGEADIDGAVSFLSRHKKPRYIELLPYHSMGTAKSRALGELPETFDAPDSGVVERIARTLRAAGFECKDNLPKKTQTNFI